MSEAARASDSEWFGLTEGMTPYERFRFIAIHVLHAGLRDALAYAKDRRIFTDVEGPATLRAHLGMLDAAVRDDATLSPLQREFLCGAVAAAMRGLEMDPTCLAHLIRESWNGAERSAHR